MTFGIALMDRKLGNIWLEGFKWEMRNWRQTTMNNPLSRLVGKSEKTWQCARRHPAAC